MVRRSLIGIGLAVAALVAFQVTGCGDSDERRHRARRDDRIGRDDRRRGHERRRRHLGWRGDDGRRRDDGRGGQRGDRHGRDDGRRRDDRRRGDDGRRRDDGWRRARPGARARRARAARPSGSRPAPAPSPRAAPARRTDALLQDLRAAEHGREVARPARPASSSRWTAAAFDPAGTFACYKIPTAANAACPAAATPQASQACTVTDMCTLCNSTGGLAGGMYMDSNAMAKTGFCVCVNAASGAAPATRRGRARRRRRLPVRRRRVPPDPDSGRAPAALSSRPTMTAPAPDSCSHLDAAETRHAAVNPSGHGCVECLKSRRRLGPPAAVHDVRPRRLLRQLAGPARDEALPRAPSTRSSARTSRARTGATATRTSCSSKMLPARPGEAATRHYDPPRKISFGARCRSGPAPID